MSRRVQETAHIGTDAWPRLVAVGWVGTVDARCGQTQRTRSNVAPGTTLGPGRRIDDIPIRETRVPRSLGGACFGCGPVFRADLSRMLPRASMAEYAFLIALIAMVVLAAALFLGTELSDDYSEVGDTLQGG